jgi:hypothetical protein
MGMTQTKGLSRAKNGPTPSKRNGKGNGKANGTGRRATRLLVTVVTAVVVLGGVVIWQATNHSRNSGSGAHGSVSDSSNPTVIAGYHVPESAFASQPPFAGPAVTKYGQPALQKAYRQLVDFAFDTGWDPTLMAKRKSALTSGDFAAVRLSLTPTCAKAFNANVTKALANDKPAIRLLEGSMFFAVGGVDAKGAADRTSTISNRAFTRAKFTVDTSHGQRLSMSFTAKATVHTQDAAGKRYTVQTGRALHYLLVPNNGADANTRPFLIDAWTSRMQSKKPQPA